MTAISFFIAGRPRATQTGSVITVRGRTFPLRRNPEWSTWCGLVARAHAPAQPLQGPVAAFITFLLPRPKKPKWAVPITRPDIDGLVKGMLDSWNGVLYADDAQIVTLLLDKLYAEDGGAPGVRVVVAPATPNPIVFFGQGRPSLRDVEPWNPARG